MNVLSICGSLQRASSNRSLLALAQSCAPAGMCVSPACELSELPHFNLDIEKNGALDVVEAFRASVRSCDAVLIACPEYGHSLPGALKNAIDWLIGSGELEGKRIAITAAVAGDGRGEKGLEANARPHNCVRFLRVWRGLSSVCVSRVRVH
jgi:chromate reductase, NAD(P)H dehydrogenase (quinone)